VRGYGLAVVRWLAGHSPWGQGVVVVAGSRISVRAGCVSFGAGAAWGAGSGQGVFAGALGVWCA
jgi:hypothetical protein